jgi:hypothetical protein
MARMPAIDPAAGRDRGEVDLRRKPRGLAEHHVAVPRTGPCVAGTVAARSPDNEVVEAVAVDVPEKPDLSPLSCKWTTKPPDSSCRIREIDRHGVYSATAGGRRSSFVGVCALVMRLLN